MPGFFGKMTSKLWDAAGKVFLAPFLAGAFISEQIEGQIEGQDSGSLWSQVRSGLGFTAGLLITIPTALVISPLALIPIALSLPFAFVDWGEKSVKSVGKFFRKINPRSSPESQDSGLLDAISFELQTNKIKINGGPAYVKHALKGCPPDDVIAMYPKDFDLKKRPHLLLACLEKERAGWLKKDDTAGSRKKLIAKLERLQALENIPSFQFTAEEETERKAILFTQADHVLMGEMLKTAKGPIVFLDDDEGNCKDMLDVGNPNITVMQVLLSEGQGKVPGKATVLSAGGGKKTVDIIAKIKNMKMKNGLICSDFDQTATDTFTANNTTLPVSPEISTWFTKLRGVIDKSCNIVMVTKHSKDVSRALKESELTSLPKNDAVLLDAVRRSQNNLAQLVTKANGVMNGSGDYSDENLACFNTLRAAQKSLIDTQKAYTDAFEAKNVTVSAPSEPSKDSFVLTNGCLTQDNLALIQDYKKYSMQIDGEMIYFSLRTKDDKVQIDFNNMGDGVLTEKQLNGCAKVMHQLSVLYKKTQINDGPVNGKIIRMYFLLTQRPKPAVAQTVAPTAPPTVRAPASGPIPGYPAPCHPPPPHKSPPPHRIKPR